MTASRSFAAGARPLRVREDPKWQVALRAQSPLPGMPFAGCPQGRLFAKEVAHRAPIS